MSEQTGHYSIMIQWSDEDQVYIASLPEWGDLVHTHGESYEDALRNGKELLEGLAAVRHQRGESLPPPHVYAATA